MVQGGTVLNVLAWMLSFAALLVLDLAAPPQINMLDHLLGGYVHTGWNDGLILITYIILVLSLAACFSALVFNLMRMKRKTDKLKISVLIITGLTVLGFVFFTLNFADVLF